MIQSHLLSCSILAIHAAIAAHSPVTAAYSPVTATATVAIVVAIPPPSLFSLHLVIIVAKVGECLLHALPFANVLEVVVGHGALLVRVAVDHLPMAELHLREGLPSRVFA